MVLKKKTIGHGLKREHAILLLKGKKLKSYLHSFLVGIDVPTYTFPIVAPI